MFGGGMNRLNIFITILSLLFFSFVLKSQVNNLTIFQEDATNFSFSYKPTIINIDTIIIDGKRYLLPVFNEPTQILKTTGGTIVVVLTKLIAVPDSNSFNLVSSLPQDFLNLNSELPDPLLIEKANYPQPQTNQPQPITLPEDSWCYTQYIGIGRNIHLAQLNLILAKYLPNSNSTTIPKEINVKISFKEVSRIGHSEIIQNILNVKQAKSWILDLNEQTPQKSKSTDQVLSTNNTFVKIKVEKEGLYRIDASMLNAIGINIPANLVNTIKLFGGNGKPLAEPPMDPPYDNFKQIPIIVKTKQNGELDYILFYGVGTQGFEYSQGAFKNYQNQYSNSNYYLLSWDGEPGLRIQLADEQIDCTNPIVPQFYYERVLFREEITNPFSSGSGNIWFGASIFPRYFTNSLPDLYRNGEIFYRIYIAQNYTDTNDNLFGQFSFFEGQNKIGEVYIPRCISYEEAKAKIFEGTLPASVIPSDSRSYLRIEYKSPTGATGTATPYFNWYEIHYPRLFKAIDKTLSFFTEPNSIGCFEYQITGFDGETIGLDVTNPTEPKLLQNKSVVLNTFNFQTNLDSSTVKRFFISSNFIKPEIEKIYLSGLRTNPLNSEVIVITHKNLINSASKYKEFREKTNNYKISIVNIEDIYNEYSFGLPDPMAIRYFLADALNNWDVKPLYVILWGDGHYDFRNISTKKTNYIPALQVADNYYSFNSTVSYTSDDFYGFLLGNDWVLDVIISRIPIYDDQTGTVYVEKLVNYETNQDKTKWRSTALFCADDSPQSKNSYDGTLHTRDSEYISNNYVPKDILVKKLYLPEYPTENIPGGRRKPLATADLVRTINEGVFLVNWLGHGNPRVWAHEELFDRDQTISLFTNSDKLFVGIAATCDFGRYDLTEIKSGTEELLFYRKGGAIAYYAATRAVFTTDNRIFNERIIQELFKRKSNGKFQTLGEAYYQVKQTSIGDNHRKYLLFGDPLIRLIIPEYSATITRINNYYLKDLPKDSLANIFAFSVVQLEGDIIFPFDSTEVKNFNGTIEVVINDVGYTKFVTDIDGTQHSVFKEGGTIAKGVLPVVNGHFSGEFFITDELSFLNGNITIRLFAWDTTNKFFAKGFENRIRIVGVDTSNNILDTEPPIINVFIDDTTFKNGDVVSNPPTLIVRLYDNTAINTTGVGIGHLIEAWIDDNPESIDLTNFYEGSPSNPKEGYVKKVLPRLTPGLHKVKVRAWDIFNNFSTSSVEFNILDPEAGIILMNPVAKPNPANSNVTFRIQHNINEPYEVDLKIFNAFAQKIYDNTYDFSKLMNFEINYNCIDEKGNLLPTGIYIYSITVRTKTKNAHISGKFAIVR